MRFWTATQNILLTVHRQWMQWTKQDTWLQKRLKIMPEIGDTKPLHASFISESVFH